MMKRIYSYITMAVAASLFLVACSGDDDKIEHFSSVVDLSQSSLADDKYDVITVFSTDGGTTFVQYPNIDMGQTYLVKAVLGDFDLTGENCFEVDWSSSSPKPKSVDGGVATFVMGSKNDLSAAVINIPFNTADAAGTYTVVTDDWADFHAGDLVTVERIDDTHIQINEYPTTDVDHSPLVLTITDISKGLITVESQYSGTYSNGPYPTNTSGSGSGSSCAGTISLVLDFEIDGDVYDGNVLELEKD